MDVKMEYFEKFADKRGDLIVFLKNSNLLPKYKKFGQIYFVTFTKKGVVRGNHYHKKIREWFGIVDGKVKGLLKDLKTGKIKRFTLSANSKKYIRLEIGPNIAHSFISLTPNASLLNYTDKEWHKEDVYQYKLL